MCWLTELARRIEVRRSSFLDGGDDGRLAWVLCGDTLCVVRDKNKPEYSRKHKVQDASGRPSKYVAIQKCFFKRCVQTFFCRS